MTGYPITFPFLETPAYIRVQITPDGDDTPTLLGESDYSVHLGDAPYVRTAVAYPSTTVVEVFRWLPYEQPMIIPEGGKLPTEALERALDRVTMLAMQSNPDGGYSVPSDGVRDVAIWANPTARALVAPTRTGQIGVQISDKTLWLADSTAVGDWGAYQIPSEPDVWSPDMLYRDGITDFTDRWVGVVPRDFKASHLRISCNYNTGLSLLWSLYEGPSLQTLATGVWTYIGGAGYTYTILVPVASWGRASGGDVLAQGTAITMAGALFDSSYGAQMYGLKLDFLGRWIG